MKTKTQERSILMNGDEVRATLAGLKTQVRRVIIPQPSANDVSYYHNGIICGALEHYETGRPSGYGFESEDYQWKSPFGEPGSMLWVKETWRLDDPEKLKLKEHEGGMNPDWIYHRADPVHEAAQYNDWRPSNHMPKWASRITCKVIRVWSERLQDIGKDGHIAHDVLAEGISRESIRHNEEFFHRDDSPAIAFSDVWDKNHKNPAHKFKANPYVFGAEYKILDKEYPVETLMNDFLDMFRDRNHNLVSEDRMVKMLSLHKTVDLERLQEQLSELKLAILVRQFEVEEE